MRIAFILWHFPVLSETFILNQITGLLDLGHEVDIFPCRRPKTAVSTIHPEIQQYGLMTRTRRLLKERETAFIRDLHPLKKQEPYDIIHCQFGVLGAELANHPDFTSLPGKLVVSFRGYDISKFVAQRGNKVYSKLFQKGSCFLPNCDYFKRRLIELGCNPSKIIVHRSGIRSDTFACNSSRPLTGPMRVITIGRLVEKKGIEYSLKAFGKFAKSHTNAHYDIIGDGTLKTHLQGLIQDLGLERQVCIHPEKNRDEILQMLNNAQALIAASVTDAEGNQEGIPNVLKEAMALGLPVIGTRHSGIPELIEDGVSGFLVPERDITSLAQKLAVLAQDSELRLSMGRQGRAKIEAEYDAKKLNRELVKIYLQAAGV